MSRSRYTLDGPWVVRGMAVDDVDAAVDQPVRKAHMRAGHVVAPVAAPVNRGHDDIAWTAHLTQAVGNSPNGQLGQIGQQVDTGPVVSGGPISRDPTRVGAECKDDHSCRIRKRDDGRRLGLRKRTPDPDGFAPARVRVSIVWVSPT